MTDPVEAIRKFGEAAERAIDDSSRRLARTFASQHGWHVREIAWGEHDNGEWSVYINLSDGHVLTGRGGGKLDALAAAEKAARLYQGMG